MLSEQWHLINTDMANIELNVTALWAGGITGDGIKVVIVDDGLDMDSEDLKANFYAEGSYDFNDHSELPKPRLSDDQHGTRCAGEIAAVPNDVCGVGVAYNAKIAGVRILSAPISDADEAAALNYAYQLNEIYSCSWGPPDDGKSMEAPEGLILKALVNGVQNGRGGKGSVYVFAAGNGGGVDDQCNFDGYTNSIFSITVGAIDRKGLHPYYSEMCAAMMIVAPSSGSGDHIHTTDVGENKCAHNHGGTSAAAPLAVGVFALALEVRPDLGWRDLQHLAVNHAVQLNPDDPDWEKTAAGRMFSYKYGYGLIDAGLFVEAARSWKLVKPQAWFDSPAVYLPDDPVASATSASSKPKRQVAESDDTTSNDPTAVLTPAPTTEPTANDPVDTPETAPPAPAGSIITDDGLRRYDEAGSGFPGWKFMSLKHWDENPAGTWTITVRDRVHPDKTGRFIAWALQLWGEAVDESKAKLWAPAEEGQPDEEETGSDPTAVSQKPKPTDHLPDDHGQASGEATQPFGGVTTVDTAEPTASPSATVDEGWFDGMEGLRSNSAWLAGAASVVVLAVAGTALFFVLRARRRRRNLFGLANSGEGGRGAYAPVSGEDVPMGILERGRRRFMGNKEDEAKELYDAFGDGPSDDDEDEEGLDERTALQYHDDFLEDEETPAARKASTSGATSPAQQAGGSNGSSGSWHDAGEDVGRGGAEEEVV
ncbi:pheromone processing endoprotease [Cryptotrichosporon argae]